MSACVRVMLIAAVLVAAGVAPVSAQSDETERLTMATRVMDEIMEAPDSSIPRSVLNNAAGVTIFPSTIKAGFIFGGHRGKGVVLARDPETGAWSAPAFLTLTGGSFGLQIGAQSVDLVLIVMNQRVWRTCFGTSGRSAAMRPRSSVRLGETWKRRQISNCGPRS